MLNLFLAVISVFFYNQGPNDGLHIAYQDESQLAVIVLTESVFVETY